MTDEPAQQSTTGRVVSIGVSSAAVALLFVVLRLLAISHYDWRTAFALADTIDLGNAAGVVTGSILGAPGPTAGLLAVLLPVVVAAHVREYRKGRRRLGRMLLMLVIVALLLAAIVTFRLWWALVLCLVVVALLVVALHRSGRLDQLVFRDVLSRLGVLSVAAIIIWAGITDEVWVPKERITVGSTQVIGYVMGSDGTFLKVLTQHDRRVRILVAGQVTARVAVD